MKHKNLNLNKNASTKNVQKKKFQKCSQIPNINSIAHSEVNKNKIKCYMCRNSLHLANIYGFINAVCNL